MQRQFVCGLSIVILALSFSTSFSAKDDAYFGPGKCIRTFKDPNSGHCVVSTSCNDVQNTELQNYDVSIICVSKGSEIRHSFGKGSFDPQESFDTLIVCDQCLSGEASEKDLSQAQGKESSEVKDMNATVQTLVTEMASLKASILSASGVIAKLNQKVFGHATSPVIVPAGSAPGAAPAASAGPSPGPAAGPSPGPAPGSSPGPSPGPSAVLLLNKGHAGLRGTASNGAQPVHAQAASTPQQQQHHQHSQITAEHVLVHHSGRRHQQHFGGHRHQMRRHGRHHQMRRRIEEEAQEGDAEQGYAEQGYAEQGYAEQGYAEEGSEGERYAEEGSAEEEGQDESTADAEAVNEDVNAQDSSDYESTNAEADSNQGDNREYPQISVIPDDRSQQESVMESDNDAVHDADDVQDQE